MSALARFTDSLVTLATSLLTRAARATSSGDFLEFANFTKPIDLAALGEIQGVEVVSVTTPANATSIIGKTKNSNGVGRTATINGNSLPYLLLVQLTTIDSVVNVTRVRVYLADVS